MTDSIPGTELERAVADHYGTHNLVERVMSALAAAGLGTGPLDLGQLAAIDEFHIGGRAATEHAVAKMGLAAGQHVLDVGCGIGGAARYLAATQGCRVTGIDLTPAYIELARSLTERAALSELVRFEVASALQLPFAHRSFDAGLTFHVAMNIADRAGLYSEVARVLRPGAVFCVYDVMQGPGQGLRFPVPWAETAATSHLKTLEETRALLEAAGFEVVDTDDRTAFGIEFFRQRLAGAGTPEPAQLGLHVIVGANAREKFGNLLEGLEHGFVKPVLVLAKRTG